MENTVEGREEDPSALEENGGSDGAEDDTPGILFRSPFTYQ